MCPRIEDSIVGSVETHQWNTSFRCLSGFAYDNGIRAALRTPMRRMFTAVEDNLKAAVNSRARGFSDTILHKIKSSVLESLCQ